MAQAPSKAFCIQSGHIQFLLSEYWKGKKFLPQENLSHYIPVLTQESHLEVNELAAEALKTAKSHFSRNYRLVVYNSAISRAGTSGFQLAILWIALLLTKSPVLAGLADGMSALPLVLSFVFGAIVDRLFSKRTFAISISIFRTFSIFALFIAILYSSLVLEVLSIYFVAFVVGMSTDVLNSIRSSWTKQFLELPQYQSGVSLLQSVTAVAEAAGYAISGLLILLGLQFAIYSFALIFGVSIAPLILLKGEKTENVAREKDIKSSVREGLKFIFGDSRLKALVIIIMAINLTIGTVGIFLVYLVEVHFRLPAIYYTTMALSVTIGIIAGSLLGSKARGRVGRYSIGTIFPTALLLFAIGNIDSIYLDYAAFLGIGILVGVLNVVINTVMIGIVDQELRGRVSGTLSTFGVSIIFVSGAIGGALIQLLTLRGAFILISIILGAVSFLPLLFRDYYNLIVQEAGKRPNAIS